MKKFPLLACRLYYVVLDAVLDFCVPFLFVVLGKLWNWNLSVPDHYKDHVSSLFLHITCRYTIILENASKKIYLPLTILL